MAETRFSCTDDEGSAGSEGLELRLGRLGARNEPLKPCSNKSSLAWISMSLAGPSNPPMGRWISIRELGRQKRLPLAPAHSKSAPMLAAWPMHSVLTSGFWCNKSQR